MTYKIAGDWLQKNGKKVDQVPSTYIGSSFAKPPKIAVIHFTYGGTARSSAEWFRSKQNPGSSAHVVIERDGTVIQCVPWGKVAWHAGKSRWKHMIGMNKHSFGIELANWGYLKKAGDGWACWTGTRINDPFLAIHKNGNPDALIQPIGWETYPEAQFAAAVAVVRALVEAYGVTEIVGHDDISPTRKFDPGPAFDMARFRASIYGGRKEDGDGLLRVSAANGLFLRSGPGTHFPPAEPQALPSGTLLHPLATNGVWTEVSVLDAAGEPRATGWVHSRYIEDA
jgi:N-acetylmuramoyl-L-alanine amidase